MWGCLSVWPRGYECSRARRAPGCHFLPQVLSQDARHGQCKGSSFSVAGAERRRTRSIPMLISNCGSIEVSRSLLIALIAFVPWPLGSVHAWAQEVVIAAAACWPACFAAKLLIVRQTQLVRSWTYLPVAPVYFAGTVSASAASACGAPRHFFQYISDQIAAAWPIARRRQRSDVAHVLCECDRAATCGCY